MTPQRLVELIEEMIDLKIQYYAELNFKHTPELARLLACKRDTDRRRLDQIKTELIRIMEIA
jgi:hypothetical protein